MNAPNDLPVTTPVEARINLLENKLAYIYQTYAAHGPGARVQEVGVVAAMWSELDFLYLAEASA